MANPRIAERNHQREPLKPAITPRSPAIPAMMIDVKYTHGSQSGRQSSRGIQSMAHAKKVPNKLNRPAIVAIFGAHYCNGFIDYAHSLRYLCPSVHLCYQW